MLLGRLSRPDRLAIVREVESQIHELLQERDTDELAREDVLAVLARLDPPEAYIPDEADGEAASAHRPIATRASRPALKRDPRVGRASGILGVAALAFVLLVPVGYLIGAAFESDAVVIVLCGGAFLLMFIASVLGLVLGIHARGSGPWALVGIVTSALALFLSLGAGTLVILLL
jgi:hypothetical protein